MDTTSEPQEDPRKRIKITKGTIERYDIRLGYDWAVFIIGEDGNFLVNSSYGDYAYWWGNHGMESFKHFLISMARDTGYLINKLAKGDDRDVFLHQETVQEIKKDIIEHRRQDFIDKESAREMYDYVKGYLEDLNDSTLFIQALYESGEFSALYSDYDSIPIRTDFSNQLKIFIKEFYPILIEQLKLEIMEK